MRKNGRKNESEHKEVRGNTLPPPPIKTPSPVPPPPPKTSSLTMELGGSVLSDVRAISASLEKIKAMARPIPTETETETVMSLVSESGQEYILTENRPMIIGRDKMSNIFLANNLFISKSHAMVSVVEGRVVIQDLQSQNGTFVNGKKIYSETQLCDGDEIKFGGVGGDGERLVLLMKKISTKKGECKMNEDKDRWESVQPGDIVSSELEEIDKVDPTEDLLEDRVPDPDEEILPQKMTQELILEAFTEVEGGQQELPFPPSPVPQPSMASKAPPPERKSDPPAPIPAPLPKPSQNPISNDDESERVYISSSLAAQIATDETVEIKSDPPPPPTPEEEKKEEKKKMIEEQPGAYKAPSQSDCFSQARTQAVPKSKPENQSAKKKIDWFLPFGVFCLIIIAILSGIAVTRYIMQQTQTPESTPTQTQTPESTPTQTRTATPTSTPIQTPAEDHASGGIISGEGEIPNPLDEPSELKIGEDLPLSEVLDRNSPIAKFLFGEALPEVVEDCLPPSKTVGELEASYCMSLLPTARERLKGVFRLSVAFLHSEGVFGKQ